MASGDPVLQIIKAIPPGANSAGMANRTGGSTPSEEVTLWTFDAAADEYMDFLVYLIGYGGGGLTVTLPWSAATATSSQVRWEVAFRRIQDDLEDIDAAHTYDYNGVSDTAPSVSGECSYPTVTFTDGADMDALANGEMAILRVHRDYDHGDDGMSGDAELWMPAGKET